MSNLPPAAAPRSGDRARRPALGSPARRVARGAPRVPRAPVGPSRHLVRFLTSDGSLCALKELPLEAGRREYDVLLHLESAGLPAVVAAGLAEVPERKVAILATNT